MKTIGILTYHRSVNYGAFMQAYSLSHRIAKDFPDAKIEIIDYESEETYRLYHKSVTNYVHMIAHASSLRKKVVYGKLMIQFILGNKNQKEHAALENIFEKQLEKLPLSKKQIITDDVSLFWNSISDKYDVIVVGSDAVWNWQIKRFPNPYFLRGESKVVKMSYAASSYGQNYLKCNDNEIKYLKEAWNTFDYIGVRDLPTENFVKMVLPNAKPIHNCDPTVFLDLDRIPVSDSEISSLLIEQGVDLNKPIIGLMCKPWLAECVRSIVGKKYQIVSVFFNSPNTDYYVPNLTPFQWAKVFRYFDVVFTHFFHGNLLSLKNGTPTIPIEKKSEYNQTFDSKIRDLMNRLDFIDNCYFYEDIESHKEEIMKKVDDMILNKKEYSKKIFKALETESHAYISFREELKSVLKKNG